MDVVNKAAGKKPEARPDALVLCTMRTTCHNCGVAHDSPAHHVLLRTGKSYIHTEKSIFLYSDLPREHIIKEESAPFCSACWQVTEGSVVVHFH